MAEQQPATGAQQRQGDPQIAIDLQYIKDLSFENPLGPELVSFVQKNPAVSVEVNTSARPLAPHRYEVSLTLRGEAKAEDRTMFVVELTYAGVITLHNVPEEGVRPVLLIEAPRLLFPFARNVVADATRDGGYPPLFIQPVDFAQLYRQQHIQPQQ
jgi:preprotein translocase subunit SecB